MNSHELAAKLLALPCAEIFRDDAEWGATPVTKIVKILRDVQGSAYADEDIARMQDEVDSLETTNTREDYDAMIANINTSDDPEYISLMMEGFETFEKYRDIFITAAERSKKTLAECAVSETSYLLMGD